MLRERAEIGAALDGAVRDAGVPGATRPVAAAVVTLHNVESEQIYSAMTSVEGVFRIFPLPPGPYQLRVEAKHYPPFALPHLFLHPTNVPPLTTSPTTYA